jgi:uncharacterized damage-inducible protein DinB
VGVFDGPYTFTFDPPLAPHADEYHSLKVELSQPNVGTRFVCRSYDGGQTEASMATTEDHRLLEALLEALLDSWDRNNTILVNLLRAVPESGLEARAVEGSKTVAEMFLHIHGTRHFVLREDAPEFALEPLKQGWRETRDPDRIAQMLNESARAVRAAVKDRVETGKEMLVRYDHPILLLQHMVWHEGYHHGQIKLALKAMGRPLDDEEIGRVTWHVWFDKAGAGS